MITSGETIIGEDVFWDDCARRGVSCRVLCARSEGYDIRSKDDLVNVRIAADLSRLLIEECVGCSFDIGTESMFCNLRGPHPTQRQKYFVRNIKLDRHKSIIILIDKHKMASAFHSIIQHQVLYTGFQPPFNNLTSRSHLPSSVFRSTIS